MNRKISYQVRSIIIILIICIASLIGPAILFPEKALIVQITAFILIFAVERYLVFKNLNTSFQAFEDALEVLRRLLPAYMAKALHFNFDLYKPSEAKETALILKMPLRKFFQSKAR